MNLSRGINLGGIFSQFDDKKPLYDKYLDESIIKGFKDSGFDHIRVPVDFKFIENSHGLVNEACYILLDQTLSWCKKYDLNVVLFLHRVSSFEFVKPEQANMVITKPEPDSNNNNDMPLTIASTKKSKEAPFITNAIKRKNYLNILETIVQRYSDCEFVAYELIKGSFENMYSDLWNELIDESVNLIRSIAPTRTIIYGGCNWTDPNTISFLSKPKDENIIFAFRYFEPYLFTHQQCNFINGISQTDVISYHSTMDYYKSRSGKLGKFGTLVNRSVSSSMGYEFHEKNLRQVIDYVSDFNVKLYCCEFGVINKAAKNEVDEWFGDVIKLFEENKIACCFWNYADVNFSLDNPMRYFKRQASSGFAGFLKRLFKKSV